MPAKKHPLTVEELWAIKRVGTPTLSPDGRSACAPVTAYDMDKNEGRTELWLFPTDGGKARRLTAGDKDSEPHWSPDGKWIAFTAKRKDDDEPQIYLIAPDGGEARRLTAVADRRIGAALVPRRQAHRVRLVGVARPEDRQGAGASAGRSARTRRSRRMSPSAPSTVSGIIGSPTAASRTSSPPTSPPAAPRPARRHRARAASRGTRRPSITTSAPTAGARADRRSRAGAANDERRPTSSALNLATRRRQRADRRRAALRDEHPRYSPDGRHRPGISYNLKRAFNDQGRLTLLERRSGRTRRLAPRLDRATTHLAWAPDSAALYLLIEDRGRQGLFRLGLERRDADAGRGRRHDQRLCASRATAGASRSTAASASHPPALFAIAPTAATSARSSRSIARCSRASRSAQCASSPSRAGAASRCRYGSPIRPNFDPKKKWPLLHYDPRRTALGAHRRLAFPLEHAGLRRAGLRRRRRQLPRLVRVRPALARIDHRQLRRQGIRRHRGRDRLHAAPGLHRPRSGWSPRGGSYGGYMVAYMNGHTDRYKTYVCHAGCYDWVSMMATDGYLFLRQGAGRVPLGQSGAGDEAVAAPLRASGSRRRRW